jgi:signal-transduction protein with cAMP-binding, CBS, and nucleotidyltransferase domain
VESCLQILPTEVVATRAGTLRSTATADSQGQSALPDAYPGALNERMSTRVLDVRSPIGRVVDREPVRIEESASLSEAAALMRQANVSSVLVGQGAIATERDITRALAAGLSTDEPIGAVASPHPVRVGALTPIVAAAALMLNEEIRHLIIEFPEGHEGVVSLRDVVAVLLQTATPEVWVSSLRLAIDAPTEMWLG